MWEPSVGALFSNPAELARLHQAEFLLSTDRLRRLSSVGASFFVPGVGSLSGGVASEPGVTNYTVGIGGLVGRYHTLGVSMGWLVASIEHIAISLGGALHFPEAISQYSGLHLGASVVNLSTELDNLPMRIQAGGAYWIVPDGARLQVTWDYQHAARRVVAGVEARLSPELWLQLGTTRFQTVLGGISVRTSYVTADLAGGNNAVVLSFGFRISDAAADRRTRSYQMGQRAFGEDRYAEAYVHFQDALVYDEYFTPARMYADTALALLTSAQEELLPKAKRYEGEGQLPEAIEIYHRLLIIDPDDDEARQSLESAEEALTAQIDGLLAVGDSLKEQRDYDRARRRYDQVLQLDPENQQATQGIADLETAQRVSFRSVLSRARSYLAQDRLSDAEREFSRVLATDPRNREARRGLNTIKQKRIEAVFEKGKEAFEDSNYFEAIRVFLDVLKMDEDHDQAKEYLARTRRLLEPEAERLFRFGLQLYMREDYRAALREWDKVLLIEPSNQDTMEYRNRAEQKLKALERLEKLE